jgi:hypothetical protein
MTYSLRCPDIEFFVNIAFDRFLRTSHLRLTSGRAFLVQASNRLRARESRDMTVPTGRLATSAICR